MPPKSRANRLDRLRFARDWNGALCLMRVLFALFFACSFAQAQPAPLPVDFSTALRSLAHTFDPRDNAQWGARPIYGPDLNWSVRRSFDSERSRAIMVELYTRGPLHVSNADCLLLILDAGRQLGKTDLDVVLPQPVFQELQRTLRPPSDADVRFKSPPQPRDGYRIHIRYHGR